jgi:outer membrane protein OmpA-like peptidoglycan-associated protein
MTVQLTAKRLDWAASFCSVPEVASSSGGDGQAGQSVDTNGSAQAPDQSTPAPAQNTQPASQNGDGGMTGVTADGAPYSAQGTAPDSSQSAPAPADGGGGMTGVTADGAPYSAQGTAPESSQSAPAPADGGGGMTGVTADGAPYSAQGTAPESSQDGGGTSTESDERSLTSSERSYAHDIFQDTLDYGSITITRGALASTGATRTVGNTINFEESEFTPGTFDLTSDGMNTLVHEMTHVWQYQHQGWTYAPAALWAQFKSWASTGHRGGAYDWRSLDKAGTPWEEWNPEAQAEAVEDYNKALRAVQSGSGSKDNYSDLGLLQKYIDHMLAGPPKASGAGGADAGAGGAPSADAGASDPSGASGGASTDGATPADSATATDTSGGSGSQDAQGGMTGVTPDGAPYSAPDTSTSGDAAGTATLGNDGTVDASTGSGPSPINSSGMMLAEAGPEGGAPTDAGVVPTAGGAGDLDAPPLPPTDSFVYFSRGSPDLTPEDQKALQGYVDRYVAAATPTPIVLNGYASVDGDPKVNQDLSQKRADAVKRFMADTIKDELISAKGLGPVAKFRNGLAAANRCVEFGPPVAAPSAKPPAEQVPDGGSSPGGGKQQDGGSQQGGGKQQDGGSQGDAGTQKVSTTVNPTPGLSLTDKQFTDIFGADVLAQWNAFRSKGGPVPPSRQLTLTLTLKGSLKHQGKKTDNLQVDWIDEPSIAVVFNSSGVAANDQEAISVVKLHWDNTILKRPIEASVLAVTQNLFTSGASPQEGGQPQVKVLVTKQIGVVAGGQFMLGDDPKGKFGLNATGFLGLDITLF